MENSLITRITGIDSELKTLAEWERYLPTLQKITEEDVARALPDASSNEVHTVYGVHKQIFEYQQAIITLLGDSVRDFDRIMTDPQSMRGFLTALTEKDMPEALMKDPEETEEQRRERMDSVNPTPPKADGKKILDFIQCGDMDGATEVFNRLSLVNKILLFAQHTSNTPDDVHRITPIKAMAVPTGALVSNIFSGNHLPMDTPITAGKNDLKQEYTLSANFDEIEGMIKDQSGKKAIVLTVYQRAMMNTLCTLYESYPRVHRGYRATSYKEFYRLLTGNPEAKLTQGKRDEIDSFISRFGSLLISTDIAPLEGSRTPDTIKMNMLNVIVEEKNPADPVIMFLAEPVILTIAKKLGEIRKTRPYIARIPLGALRVEMIGNGSKKNIGITSYLAEQIHQRIYAMNNNKSMQSVIALAPLYQAIGEAPDEEHKRTRASIEKYMDGITHGDRENRPFKELKSWHWIDSRRNKATRKRNNDIYALKLEFYRKDEAGEG